MELFGINAIALSGLFVALATAVIGAAMFILGKERDHYLWGLFCLAVCIWSGCFFFIAQTQSPSEAEFYWKLSHVGVIFIPIIFFHFSLEFVQKRERAAVSILYAIGVFLVYLDLRTDLLISGTRYVFGQFYYDTPGPLYLYLTAFFVMLILYAHYLVYRAYKRSKDPLFRIRTRYFFFSTSIGFIGGGISFLPVYNIDIYPITILAVSVAPPIIGIAILRYKLFDIRVVTAQFLTLILGSFALFRLAVASGIQEILLNLLFFVITIGTGLYLIRSVEREVEQREEIERLSNEKSEFMSFASHEIRNPITAMRGFASLIVDGTVEEGQAKSVAQKILVNGDTVLSLISEFLNKSKLELGQIAYSVADVDVGKIVASIGEGFKAHARENGLSLDVKIDFQNLMAKADEAKLREVVGNLIDNSVKYTKTGGVTVTVEKRNGMARIVVSDTGVGIPQETISHLFQKFSRADAHKMNLLGTGLGLYLAKTFIEGMGGKIWAESDGQGKGSRFIIELHTV